MDKKKQNRLFPEIEQIVATLRDGSQQELLILIIPSHDRDEKELPDQHMWAQSGLDLLGDLFGGATSFQALAGVYKSESEKLLHDRPILIESYVSRESLENLVLLKQLVAFCKRMGRETRQEAVALIVANAFHTIDDFRE